MPGSKRTPPPYRIKAVEPIHLPSPEEREEALREAGYNLFDVASEDVYVDLLTDSGVGSMSSAQWGALMSGDESYAGGRSFHRFQEAVEDVLGFPHVLPMHQGRGAEHVFNRVLLEGSSRRLVVGNAPFDTTRGHIEDKGGRVVDVTVPEGRQPAKHHPFKGNVDLDALEEVLRDRGGEVAYVLVTVTCNSLGGQPVSLSNLQGVAKLAREHEVRLFLDVARFAENAWFVKQREEGQGNRSVEEITREMMGLVDGVLMSAKKNALVNIGGFIAVRDEALFDELVPPTVLHEGFPTYGGLAGRDLAAMAVGLREGVGEEHLAHRVGQVSWLHETLRERGIPLLSPPGGHAVYLDALSFLPHLPRDELPGQTLAVELYREGGVRTVEIGTVLRGRDPDTGENVHPEMELVRLAIPARTYTRSHLEHVVETVVDVWKRREDIPGLAFDEETPTLRHFTSTFEPA